MDRTAYNKCMIPWMKGGGPDRKLRFCIGAKLCSGKSKTEEEGAKLCAEAAANPKPGKVKRTRKGSIDTTALATCVIKNLDGSAITLDNLVPIIAGCTGQKVAKSLTYKRFMSSCIKETSEGGDFIHSQPDIKRCQAKWNAMRGG